MPRTPTALSARTPDLSQRQSSLPGLFLAWIKLIFKESICRDGVTLQPSRSVLGEHCKSWDMQGKGSQGYIVGLETFFSGELL